MSALSATIRMPKKAGVNYKRVLGSSKEHKRSSVKIAETKEELNIRIEANDITSLRASINAVTRDLQVIEDTIKATEKFQK